MGKGEASPRHTIGSGDPERDQWRAKVAILRVGDCSGDQQTHLPHC